MALSLIVHMPGAEVVISRWHATEGVCVGFLQSLLYKSYDGL